MRYRLGIDIGTSSVALAAYELNEHSQPVRLVYLDELIFGEPVSPGDFVLNNAVRRQKRLMRRNWARKKARIQKILHLAALTDVDASALRKAAADLGHTSEVWHMRAKALENRIELSQFFLILLRMAKNRGYAGIEPRSTKSTVGNAIRQAAALIESQGARTIGEALWKSAARSANPSQARFRKLFTAGKGAEAIRGTYVLRSDLEREFDLILACQKQHHPQLSMPLDSGFGSKGALLLRDGSRYFFGTQPRDFGEALRCAVFYQHPLKPFKPTIGKCDLVPGELRVPVAHPDFQRFRLEKLLADLRWKKGRTEHPLTADQRTVIRALLLLTPEADFEEIYGSLVDHDCMPEGSRLNLHTVRTTYLRGDQTTAAWRSQKRLTDWERLTDEQQGKVILALADEIGDPQQWQSKDMRSAVEAEFGKDVVDFLNLLSDEDGKLKRLSAYGLPSGRASYGATACRALAQLMESEGLDEAAAIEKAYPERRTVNDITATGHLPDVNTLELRSPVVLRALQESRKAIEACIRRLKQAPTSVVVELMADMRRTLEQRRTVADRQRFEENLNRKAAKDIVENGYEISPSKITRWVLWQQQARMCPYSGQSLSLRDALDGAMTHYEHILPKSLQGIGNRKSGLVLALNHMNQLKGDETPWAAARQYPNTWDWNATKGAVKAITKANRNFRRKAAMILNPISAAEAQNDVEQTMDRQYSDTAWIGREVHKWCKHLCSDVTVVRGALTASLRRQWGLENILEEVRIQEGRHGEGIANLPATERIARMSERVKKLFYRQLPHGEFRFDKRSDHRHHLIDAAVIGLSSRSLYQGELRRRARPKQEESVPCPVAGLREELISRLTGYVVWRKPNRLVSGRMFDEMPFRLLSNGRLGKRGEEAKRSFNPKLDKVIRHSDRHGREHSKVLVNAQYACMRVAESGLTLLSMEQFEAGKYVRGNRISIPPGEMLLFKDDIVFSPLRRKFFRVAQFSDQSGLMCVDPVETATFEELKGTGLNAKLGKLKELRSLLVFPFKPQMAAFAAQSKQGRNAS